MGTDYEFGFNSNGLFFPFWETTTGDLLFMKPPRIETIEGVFADAYKAGQDPIFEVQWNGIPNQINSFFSFFFWLKSNEDAWDLVRARYPLLWDDTSKLDIEPLCIWDTYVLLPLEQKGSWRIYAIQYDEDFDSETLEATGRLSGPVGICAASFFGTPLLGASFLKGYKLLRAEITRIRKDLGCTDAPRRLLFWDPREGTASQEMTVDYPGDAILSKQGPPTIPDIAQMSVMELKQYAEKQRKFGSRSNAIRAYEELVKRTPEEWAYWDALTETYIGSSRQEGYDAAEKILLSLRQKFPQNFRLELKLRTIYAITLRHEEELSVCERLTEIDPSDWRHWNSLALAYKRVADLKNATRAAREWVRLAPKNDLAWDLLASLCEAQEEWDDAITAYEQTLSLKGNHWSAPSTRRKLEDLRKRLEKK